VSAGLLLNLNFLHATQAPFEAFIRFGLSGMLYLAIVILLVVAAPELTGVSRDELKQLFRQLFQNLRLPDRREGDHE
jgi:hypothetical protein